VRALTLWQPWASLLAAGAKRFETRSRVTHYRGPLLIHAAARKFSPTAPRDAEILRHLNRPAFVEAMTEVLGHADLERLPYGAIIASARLEDCQQLPEGLHYIPSSFDRQLEREALFGDFTPGRYLWRVEIVRKLDVPVRAPGARMLWSPALDLIARVSAEIERMEARP